MYEMYRHKPRLGEQNSAYNGLNIQMLDHLVF